MPCGFRRGIASGLARSPGATGDASHGPCPISRVEGWQQHLKLVGVLPKPAQSRRQGTRLFHTGVLLGLATFVMRRSKREIARRRRQHQETMATRVNGEGVADHCSGGIALKYSVVWHAIHAPSIHKITSASTTFKPGLVAMPPIVVA
nr:hypothetical protein CFP56_36374 [Quercus suber]